MGVSDDFVLVCLFDLAPVVCYYWDCIIHILQPGIYFQVRKANRERQQLSKLQRREMGLATMLLCVVVVFLLCNVLPLVNNILESFYDTSVDQLVAISNFLVVVNSSVNFVIYCTCGERFRRLLIRLCRDFIWCRLGTRSNYRGSLYRKSHYYRGESKSRKIQLINCSMPIRESKSRCCVVLYSNVFT